MRHSWALLFLVCGISLGLLGAELVARFSLPVSASEARVQRENASSPAPSEGLRETGLGPSQLAAHPFFGYVGNPALGNVNRFGLFTRHEIKLCAGEARLCWGDDSLTIGIFGGSLAGQVASDEEALTALFAPAFPGKKIRVVNFAIAGHAQPQALEIFSYFRDLVQVAIFIDGLNEIWNPVDNNRLGFPPIYAKSLHYRGLIEQGRGFVAKEKLRIATERSLTPLWRSTALAHVLWLNAREAAMDSLRELEAGAEGRAPFFHAAKGDLVKLGVGEWASAHRQANALGREMGIRLLHFLQPTLFSGMKKRTAEEEKAAAQYPELKTLVDLGYPLLVAEAKKLGVRDLTTLFDYEPQEVWIDAAHVNARGVMSLREAIAKQLRLR